ncbi:unnamed protein product, partial [Allacma fusca]
NDETMRRKRKCTCNVLGTLAHNHYISVW